MKYSKEAEEGNREPRKSKKKLESIMERPTIEKPKKLEVEPEEEDKKFKEMKEDTRIFYNLDIVSIREKNKEGTIKRHHKRKQI